MAKRGIRILLVSPLPPPVGGIATWTALVCKETQSHRDVDLAALDTAVRWRTVTSTALLPRVLGGAFQSVAIFLRFLFAAIRCRPRVVHLCTSCHLAAVKDCLILAACRVLRLPAVLHFHFGRLPELAQCRNWEWRLASLSIRLSTRAVVIDPGSLAAMKEIFPGKIVYLPNMVDLARLDQIVSAAPGEPLATPEPSPSGPLITLVGHVVPRKGVRELTAACLDLRREFPGLRLRIVGPWEPEDHAELFRIAGEPAPPAASWLHCTGGVDYPAALRHMAEGTIFCLPSYTEGFPYVILEAMAMGKPIISTPVGAIPQALDIGGVEECGVCVAPRQIEPLTEALRRFLHEPAQALELGRRASIRCRREYGAPSVVNRLVSLWKALACRTS